MTHLATCYAPGSFLKPCLVVDTVFNAKTKETALRFVEALHLHHAFDLVYHASQDKSDSMKTSEWIVIKTYTTREEAIAGHLELTKHLHNGGSEDEWSEGWEPYLALYDEHCPWSRRNQ